MSTYIIEITSDLMFEVFNNEMYSLFVISFLFATGLALFKQIKSAI